MNTRTRSWTVRERSYERSWTCSWTCSWTFVWTLFIDGLSGQFANISNLFSWTEFTNILANRNLFVRTRLMNVQMNRSGQRENVQMNSSWTFEWTQWTSPYEQLANAQMNTAEQLMNVRMNTIYHCTRTVCEHSNEQGWALINFHWKSHTNHRWTWDTDQARRAPSRELWNPIFHRIDTISLHMTTFSLSHEIWWFHVKTIWLELSYETGNVKYRLDGHYAAIQSTFDLEPLRGVAVWRSGVWSAHPNQTRWDSSHRRRACSAMLS